MVQYHQQWRLQVHRYNIRALFRTRAHYGHPGRQQRNHLARMRWRPIQD